MNMHVAPQPGALDVETTIIHMSRAIRGFTSGRDVVARLSYLGYSMTDIMAHSGAAIAREYLRQIHSGERAGIVTSLTRAPWAGHTYEWSAMQEGFQPGDPVGVGESEFRAILDLVRQMEASNV